jgi:hypothetical protein
MDDQNLRSWLVREIRDVMDRKMVVPPLLLWLDPECRRSRRYPARVAGQGPSRLLQRPRAGSVQGNGGGVSDQSWYVDALAIAPATV